MVLNKTCPLTNTSILCPACFFFTFMCDLKSFYIQKMIHNNTEGSGLSATGHDFSFFTQPLLQPKLVYADQLSLDALKSHFYTYFLVSFLTTVGDVGQHQRSFQVNQTLYSFQRQNTGVCVMSDPADV